MALSQYNIARSLCCSTMINMFVLYLDDWFDITVYASLQLGQCIFTRQVRCLDIHVCPKAQFHWSQGLFVHFCLPSSSSASAFVPEHRQVLVPHDALPRERIQRSPTNQTCFPHLHLSSRPSSPPQPTTPSKTPCSAYRPA